MASVNKWFLGTLGILLVSSFIIGLTVGKGSGLALSAENETYQELKVFAEVLSLIQKNYVEETGPKDLVYGAIRGMLGALDPHSVFMTPDMYREVQVDTKGEFGGLGIQIGIKEGQLTVIAPIEDTPAFRAGIQAGDWIVKVDDSPTKDMSLLDAVQKMRGPRGTEVVLTIHREDVQEPIKIPLIRENIRIKSVKSRMMDDSIAYIRISQFQERTGKDLAEHIKKLMDSGMQSVILDLRNNPGGLLTGSLEVSEQFLPPDKLIVYTKTRDGKKDEYRSSGKSLIEKMPMIVLMNEGSASASEIVSGALQDWGRAVILGSTSFGKGSVQTILPLSDNSGLRLTTALYYTPEGRSIHKLGIKPDIEVEQRRSKDLPPPIREKDLGKRDRSGENHGKVSGQITLPSESDEEDNQLNKAVELLKSWEIFKNVQGGPDLSIAARKVK